MLIERGERVLFYSECGDVAINAVTATCTFGSVFSHPGSPMALTVDLFHFCSVIYGVIVRRSF